MLVQLLKKFGFSDTDVTFKPSTPIPLNPFSEGLKLTYNLQYPNHSWLSNQSHTITLSEETFEKEIAPARTFVLKEEIEFLQKAGFGK